jgi:hypothetical protein
MAMALFAMVIMVGPPSARCWRLITNYSWPWILHQPAGRPARSSPGRGHGPRRAHRRGPRPGACHLDIAGIAPFAIGITALQYVLERAPVTTGSPPDHRPVTFLCVVAFVASIASSRPRGGQPAPVRDPTFAAGNRGRHHHVSAC